MFKRVKGQKLKLEGFNNLTKSLSFNIYDICYARSKESQIDYLEYVDEEYKAERLQEIVEEVCRIIDAKLVNVSTQDYEPRGASVVALISEGMSYMEKLQLEGTVVAGHLDKSHITIHTYPEHNISTGIATFRVDIDVSTCGMISPLNALHALIGNFDSDVVLMDYRVRGFTRDSKGKKVFIDHDITSIQDYISEDVLSEYLA
ncbi:MAG: adenosylmethionine decarboxylase, partial [Desulforhabdus sp.]|nr:adenosylmethionine decarboxylase [Desulforhabdus sp.]